MACLVQRDGVAFQLHGMHFIGDAMGFELLGLQKIGPCDGVTLVFHRHDQRFIDNVFDVCAGATR